VFKSQWLVFILLLAVDPVYSQIGGTNAFTFLELSTNARQAGLGGVNVALAEPGINGLFQNPALVDDQLTEHLALNYHRFLGTVDHFSAAYADQIKNLPHFAVGLQYLDYGSFDSFDASGNPIGEFDAAEFAIVLGTSHQVDHFRVGVNMKLAVSRIAAYSASAFLFDVGGVFKHPEINLTAGIVVKNVGFAFQQYSEEGELRMPLNVQAGVTFKPEYMPFRFSLNLNHLNRTSLNAYSQRINNGDPDGVDKVLKHLVFGTELLLNENMIVCAGYNHLERKELSMEQITGGAGFSIGLLIKTKKFSFSYAHAFHHVSGGSNFITLSSDLKTLIRKKELKD